MTLKEHIDDIRKGLKDKIFINEAAVCDYIVRRLLVDALGWPRHAPNVVIREYGVEGTRVDFALCHPPLEPRVFIEVKKVGNIEGGEKQLFQYAFHEGIPIAILTDGQEWHFFHPIGEGAYKERRVCELDLTKGDSEEIDKLLNRYLNYEAIRTNKAVKAIKDDYQDLLRQKEIEKCLPEVWNELVQEKNDYLLLAMMEKTKHKVGYEPTEKQVLGFLKSLKSKTELENGRHPPNQKSGLFVIMPNEEIVNHSVSATTFAEVIEKLGIERVRSLKHKVGRLPLISTSKDPILGQRKSGRYYIMTNTSTKKKKALLEKIATDLGEPLRIEIVD